MIFGARDNLDLPYYLVNTDKMLKPNTDSSYPVGVIAKSHLQLEKILQIPLCHSLRMV